MRVLALGGNGSFGSFAVRTLVNHADVTQVIIGCRDVDSGQVLANHLGSDKLVVQEVDVADARALRHTISQSDVVLNATGPSYLLKDAVLEASIREQRPYVDLCDDAVAAEALFDLDSDAREAGVTAIAGLGCSAGLTNLAAQQGAARLDVVTGVHVIHGAAPGEPLGGKANLLHLLDLVHENIPVVNQGDLDHVPAFAELEPYDFGPPLGIIPCGLIGHPEPVMFKRSIDGLQECSVRLGLTPDISNDFLRVCTEYNLTSDAPISVQGIEISPREFMAHHLYHESGAEEEPYLAGDGPAFGVHVLVDGTRDGDQQRLTYSTFQGAGIMTGVPLALGAIWLGKGRISEPGVFSADQCIDPDAFLEELEELGVQGLQPIDTP